MLASVLTFASCLGSNNDSTDYYNNTSITEFYLATVNRYVHTTSKSGGDSVYVKKLTNPVVFTIDQYQRKIYNTDSLPVDCDLKHVMAQITTKNYGSVVIKSLNSDSLTVFNSNDSIDFSKPREIRVYAQDLSDYRAYEVTVNIHQVESDKMLWESMTLSDIPSDAKDILWKKTLDNPDLKAFIGSGRASAYAFSNDNRLMISKDNGGTWAPDDIDSDSSLLPTENFAFVSWPFSANDSTDYQLMVGTSEQDDVACVVWRKLDEFALRSLPSRWIYMPVESYNKYYLPKMESLNLLYFGGSVLAIGNNGKIYESRDLGITWKTTTKYTLPDGIGTYELLAATDSDKHIWLVGKDTGEIWRGTLIE